MNQKITQLAHDAQSGDHTALEEVVREIQDMVHHLSMRILVNPEDASDATQEILILVITKLSTFEGKSAFRTWVYRVAVNYLLTAKKILKKDLGLNFEAFRDDLETGLESDLSVSAENLVMINELRIACTMAMLLCLDMKHRVAYVLGDILELDHNEATEILNISKENYRKRLSRARKEVVNFTSNNCGIVNDKAKCACPRRLPSAIKMGRLNPGRLNYAVKNSPEYNAVIEQTKKVEGMLKTLCMQRATPQFSSPQDFGNVVSKIVEGNYQ